MKYLDYIINRLELIWVIYIKEKILLKRPADRFYRIFGGHVFFQVLRSAVKLDLFTLLDDNKKMTVEQIYGKLSIEKQPCHILLLPLVALGLLKKKGEYYYNSFEGKYLFSRNSPQNVISYVELQHCVYYPSMPYFHDSVLEYKNIGVQAFEGNEPTLYERLEHNPEVQKVFQVAMQELSLQANKYLAKHLDLSKNNFLCDIGGGNGTNIIGLAKQNPNLKAAVFDFPGVVKLANANIEKNGLQERLSTITGNAFKDEFPTGIDCFLFCHFFTMWSKDEDLTLLQKAYEALPSGGKAVIFNMMQSDDRSGPLSAALGSPYFLACATGRGMVYSWSDYQEVFEQAGFHTVQTKKLPLDHGIIVGTKA